MIDWLFGRRRQRPDAGKAPAVAKRRAPFSGPGTSAGETRPNTLGWLLDKSPPQPGRLAGRTAGTPEIHARDRQRLRAHINRIPPMPEIWHQLQRILQQPESSASDLGRCVARDPVLTARILQVCNSPAYAALGGSKLTNIPLAIARLGMDEASNIIFRTLAPPAGNSEANKLEIRHIWFHSQATAMLSRMLAESSDRLGRHEASLAGMLHDIGKLVILHLEPQEKLDSLGISIEQGLSPLAVEFEILGYTHIDAGIMLARHWQLPGFVQRFISFHHQPTAAVNDDPADDLQHAVMTLHVAHLILQHFMQDEQLQEGRTIWQRHRHTLAPGTIDFVQHAMHVPLQSEVLYAQMQAEIGRLKLTFPGLFRSA